MATFHATFSESEQLNARFLTEREFAPNFGEVQYVHVADWYEGEYTVTPSDLAQTIPAQGKTFLHDLIIEPIPSNYGLITWNGSTLTVS